jgi:Rne/Rng family ribonuclease
MLSKIIIYTDKQNSYTFAYNSSSQLEYYLVDSLESNSQGVFLAKITNIQSRNNLAWINYEFDKVGVINLPKGHSLQNGSKIVCQMTSIGSHSKMPKLSQEIKLAGKYVVLLPALKTHHYANSLIEHQKLDEISKKYKDIGLIFRSSINSLTDLKVVEAEILLLSSKLVAIAKPSTLGCVLDGIPNYIELLYKYSEGLNIVTNSNKIFDSLKSCIDLWGIDELSLDSDIDKPNIELNNVAVTSNGIKLNIHKLSGINLIDIDSGSSNLSFYQVNLLAIDDIVKQIKLHDLSGIILIDFIKNMSNKECLILSDKIKKLFQDDWRRNKVLGFTKAGLCEIIRSK